MSQGKRKTPEQIINYLREAEVLLSQGHTVQGGSWRTIARTKWTKPPLTRGRMSMSA